MSAKRKYRVGTEVRTWYAYDFKNCRLNRLPPSRATIGSGVRMATRCAYDCKNCKYFLKIFFLLFSYRIKKVIISFSNFVFQIFRPFRRTIHDGQRHEKFMKYLTRRKRPSSENPMLFLKRQRRKYGKFERIAIELKRKRVCDELQQILCNATIHAVLVRGQSSG